jgi:hypothetical protein
MNPATDAIESTILRAGVTLDEIVNAIFAVGRVVAGPPVLCVPEEDFEYLASHRVTAIMGTPIASGVAWVVSATGPQGTEYRAPVKHRRCFVREDGKNVPIALQYIKKGDLFILQDVGGVIIEDGTTINVAQGDAYRPVIDVRGRRGPWTVDSKEMVELRNTPMEEPNLFMEMLEKSPPQPGTVRPGLRGMAVDRVFLSDPDIEGL